MRVPVRRPALLRDFAPADLLTLGNAACGTLAILLCLEHVATGSRAALWQAFGLLPLALLLDVADGYVARMDRARQSPFGADLDSLADVISFGVAPAVLGFALGLRGGWDRLILTYFVACGVSRLARFNVTAAALTDERSGKVRYFEGTPIPTSIGLVALLAVAVLQERVGDRLWLGQVPIAGAILHPLALLYALSGTAMVSTSLRIPKP